MTNKVNVYPIDSSMGFQSLILNQNWIEVADIQSSIIGELNIKLEFSDSNFIVEWPSSHATPSNSGSGGKVSLYSTNMKGTVASSGGFLKKRSSPRPLLTI
jgi:hypothetical protein